MFTQFEIRPTLLLAVVSLAACSPIIRYDPSTYLDQQNQRAVNSYEADQDTSFLLENLFHEGIPEYYSGTHDLAIRVVNKEYGSISKLFSYRYQNRSTISLEGFVSEFKGDGELSKPEETSRLSMVLSVPVFPKDAVKVRRMGYNDYELTFHGEELAEELGFFTLTNSSWPVEDQHVMLLKNLNAQKTFGNSITYSGEVEAFGQSLEFYASTDPIPLLFVAVAVIASGTSGALAWAHYKGDKPIDDQFIDDKVRSQIDTCRNRQQNVGLIVNTLDNPATCVCQNR